MSIKLVHSDDSSKSSTKSSTPLPECSPGCLCSGLPLRLHPLARRLAELDRLHPHGVDVVENLVSDMLDEVRILEKLHEQDRAADASTAKTIRSTLRSLIMTLLVIASGALAPLLFPPLI